MEHTQIIQDTLRELGAGRKRVTQRRTVVAIGLALEDEDRLLHVTKEIYHASAEICGCKWTAVERSIRLVVQRIWSDNAEGLIQMAGYPLSEAPTASDFVEILSHYIRKHGAVEVQGSQKPSP